MLSREKPGKPAGGAKCATNLSSSQCCWIHDSTQADYNTNPVSNSEIHFGPQQLAFEQSSYVQPSTVSSSEVPQLPESQNHLEFSENNSIFETYDSQPLNSFGEVLSRNESLDEDFPNLVLSENNLFFESSGYRPPAGIPRNIPANNRPMNGGMHDMLWDTNTSYSEPSIHSSLEAPPPPASFDVLSQHQFSENNSMPESSGYNPPAKITRNIPSNNWHMDGDMHDMFLDTNSSGYDPLAGMQMNIPSSIYPMNDNMCYMLCETNMLSGQHSHADEMSTHNSNYNNSTGNINSDANPPIQDAMLHFDQTDVYGELPDLFQAGKII